MSGGFIIIMHSNFGDTGISNYKDLVRVGRMSLIQVKERMERCIVALI